VRSTRIAKEKCKSTRMEFREGRIKDSNVEIIQQYRDCVNTTEF
jgi:hypothetical protein